MDSISPIAHQKGTYTTVCTISNLQKGIQVRHKTLTARCPWQIRDGGEAVDEVEERPRDDDAVVDVEEEDNRHRGVADSFQHWHKLPDEGRPPGAEVLPRGNLLQEHKNKCACAEERRLHTGITWKKMGMPQANMAMK